MKNLLVGNGINIQFNRTDYTTQAIVLRILEEFDAPDFPTHVITTEPTLQKIYMGNLFLYARQALEGRFDNVATCSSEKIALADFIERYKDSKNSLRITDIGFEDYYLIHDLVCHKFGIMNPEQYEIREALRFSYLYAIYNHGKLNLLHNQYSNSFKDYLKSFDNIFSTNYDSNIELSTGKDVYHIHGQFNRLSETYNPNSFRNQLQDKPMEDMGIDLDYSYIYSTAISTYCGDYKQYYINQGILANSATEKLAEAYLNNEDVRNDVEKWEQSTNPILLNLADSVKLKARNPKYRFQEDYPLQKLKEMTGSLTILGLSPYNDYHIFELIDNANLDECIYYYFSASEKGRVETIFPSLKVSNRLKFESVQNFWGDM